MRVQSLLFGVGFNCLGFLTNILLNTYIDNTKLTICQMLEVKSSLQLIGFPQLKRKATLEELVLAMFQKPF